MPWLLWGDGETHLKIIGIILIIIVVGGVIYVNFDNIKNIILGAGMVTPPTQMVFSLSGTPARIDNSYLAVNTRWTMTVTCDSKLLFSGYRWDVDKMINDGDYKTSQGELVARKNLDIEITPTYTYLIIPLEKLPSITILEGKTGRNMDDTGNTISIVSTNPVTMTYYVVKSGVSQEIVSPLKITVNGKSSVFNFSTTETITFEGVTFSQLGRLMPNKVLPTWGGFMLIPIDDNAPTVTGEVKDSNGKRWLILDSLNAATASSLINPSLPTSYNKYVWGDDHGGVIEGLGTIYPGPSSLFGPDRVVAPGWGAFFRLDAGIFLNVAIAEYPRGGALYKSSLPSVRNGTVYESWVGPLTYRKCMRLEQPVLDFMTFLTDRVYVMNPTASDPKPDYWFIDTVSGSPKLVFRYPSCYYPEMLNIQFPGEKADIVVYSPITSSFQLLSVTTDVQKVLGGQTAKVTVAVKNNGTTEATAKIYAKSENNVFILDKDAYSLTLAPGATGYAYFNCYYGGDQQLSDRIIITLKDTDGRVWGQGSVSLQTDAPVGGLFITGVDLDSSIEYGRWSNLVVTVKNKQGITYTDVKVVVEYSSPFKVNPGQVAKQCPSGDTAFEFKITVESQNTNTRGELRIKLYRGSTLLQTVTVGVTGNPFEEPPPPPPSSIFTWACIILILLGVVSLVLGMVFLVAEKDGAGMLLLIGVMLIVAGALILYVNDYISRHLGVI
ncbi:MAG: hypothetical protein QXF26_06460 [Candidatus Bathyarchaeia archaeon]